MVSFRSLLSATLLVLGGAFVFQACSGGQGEAKRCEQTNGNGDCASGLECVQRECCSDTICCPVDRNAATTSECKGAAVAPIDASPVDTAVVDTGATDTGATDTGSTDAGSDTATGADTATSSDAADAG
jgi:hypothetical protein